MQLVLYVAGQGHPAFEYNWRNIGRYLEYGPPLSQKSGHASFTVGGNALIIQAWHGITKNRLLWSAS